MIAFQLAHLKVMTEAAEAAYPLECCGLIAGFRGADDDLVASRIVPSANLATTSHRDSFEVDPKVRFDLMRDLEDTDEDIIGHYHSHPDHPAQPSETDLSMVYEPDLIWIILSVQQARVADTRAFRASGDPVSFAPLDIHTSESNDVQSLETDI